MARIIVIMPFTAEWSDKVWTELSRITVADTGGTLLVDRVDMMQVTEPDLDKHIEEQVSNGDVIVADLTEGNQNVHIEVGYALALKKPLIFIVQDRKWVPAHLRGKIVEEYKVEDTTSLERLRHVITARIRDKIEAAAGRLESAKAKHQLAEQYPVECYANRDAIGLERYFREAARRIDILTTNLSFLFDEPQSPEYKRQTPPKTYFDEIKNALDRKDSTLKVRILTLDPESDFAAKRGRQLAFAPAVFRDQLRKALKDTKQIADKYPSDRFEVRTYEDFPNQITFRIDDYVFSCVVAQPTQSRNHLAIKLDRHQVGVENSFINHFQNVWGKTSTG